MNFFVRHPGTQTPRKVAFVIVGAGSVRTGSKPAQHITRAGLEPASTIRATKPLQEGEGALGAGALDNSEGGAPANISSCVF
jgi:hypothetical protein